LSAVCQCADEILSLSQLYDLIIQKGKPALTMLRKDTHMEKIERAEKACNIKLDLVKKQIETAYEYYSPKYVEHAKNSLLKALRLCATPI